MKMNVYTTSEVEEVIKLYESGKTDKRISDLFYRRDINVRNSGVMLKLTSDEMQEYIKCSNDPLYFFNNYCKVNNGKGVEQIKLYNYQEEIIKSHNESRFNIVATSRQSGITLIESLLILHDIVFKNDLVNMLCSYKMASAIEKMENIKSLYYNLPYYMKPGVTSWNIGSICFDNFNRVIAKTDSKNIAIGFNIHRLYVDDYSMFFSNNIPKSLFPMMMALKDSKIFICSTPNGFNHFYEMFTNAERKEGDPKKNAFKAHRVYWWEVPGRDEEWKKQQILCLGSEATFNQEYDLQFFAYKS